MGQKRLSSYKKRRINLWKQNPHCHWCGCVTILPDDILKDDHERIPYTENMATVDHLYTRLTGLRYTMPSINGCNTVLACNKCNNDRNRVEEKMIGIEELRRRAESGRAHLRVKEPWKNFPQEIVLTEPPSDVMVLCPA